MNSCRLSSDRWPARVRISIAENHSASVSSTSLTKARRWRIRLSMICLSRGSGVAATRATTSLVMSSSVVLPGCLAIAHFSAIARPPTMPAGLPQTLTYAAHTAAAPERRAAEGRGFGLLCRPGAVSGRKPGLIGLAARRLGQDLAGDGRQRLHILGLVRGCTALLGKQTVDARVVAVEGDKFGRNALVGAQRADPEIAFDRNGRGAAHGSKAQR